MRVGVTDFASTVLPRLTAWKNKYLHGEEFERGHTVVAQQDGSWRNSLLLSNLDDWLGAHQRAACASQRAVGHDMNPVLPAEVNNLLLGEAGVVLNLVDSGDNGGVWDELLEVFLAVLFRFVRQTLVK